MEKETFEKIIEKQKEEFEKLRWKNFDLNEDCAAIVRDRARKMKISEGELLEKMITDWSTYSGKIEFIRNQSSLIEKKNRLMTQKIRLIDEAFEVMKIAKEMKIGGEDENG